MWFSASFNAHHLSIGLGGMSAQIFLLSFLKIGVPVFLLMSFTCSFYISNATLLADGSLVNIFSHSVLPLYIFLTVPFTE
jgi:hypothetical protein